MTAEEIIANEIQALKAVMVQILNKNTNISLDGRVLNKGLDQVKSKIG